MAAKTDKIDVSYVANLARIKLSDAEKELFQKQLNQIVSYVRQIEQVNVDGIEPMAHAIEVKNVLREDKPQSDRSLSREVVLQNSPSDNGEQITAPKIIAS
jgi:aspartyl-tRNA(Asn)/glutamyl-tRNA(Gln) amidotransferase subunit C